MAGTIKGLTIAIGGDTSGLGKALKDADSKASGLSKELSAVKKQLKYDPSNVKLLAQEHQVLKEEVAATNDKLKALKETQKELRKLPKNEQDAATMRALQREISATEGKLKTYKKELKESSKGHQAWEKAVKAAKAIAVGFGKAAKAAGEVAATAITAAATAATAAATALTACTTSAASFADEILTASTVTGVSTDKLQEMQYAAELVDVSVDTITGSMRRNIRSMTSAAEGTESVANAYAALGVEVTNADGTLRDGETVYWELIDALGKVEDETTRDSLAMEVLGKSAQDLNPLIEAGSGKLQELGQQAHDAGYVMSGDTLNAFGAFDDQMQYLQVGATAAKNALGLVLLPTLTQLAGEGVGLLNDFSSGMQEAGGDVDKTAVLIGDLIPKAVGIVAERLPEIITMATTIVTSLTSALVDKGIPALIEVVPQLIESFTGAITGENLETIISSATTLIETLVGSINANLPTIINAGLDIIISLANGIGKSLPTLIPSVINTVLTIVNTLLKPDRIDSLVQAAITLMEGLTRGIIAAIPQIVQAIPQIIVALVGAILRNLPELLRSGIQMVGELAAGLIQAIPVALKAIGDLLSRAKEKLIDKGQLKKWGSDMIQGIIDGIKSMISNVGQAAAQVAEKIKNFLHFSRPDEGPLRDYEKWMPDMVDGLVKGINKSKSKLDRAMYGLTAGASEALGLAPSSRAGASINSTSLGGVNITVYGAQGQDVRELADVVMNRLQTTYDGRRAAWA